MNIAEPARRGVKQGLAYLLGATTLFGAGAAQAVFVDPSVAIPTELISFGADGISGTAYLPLTSAATTSTEAGAPAATADGYGWVRANIAVSLSASTPSVGEARLSKPFDYFGVEADAAALTVDGSLLCIEGGMAGDVANGDTVCVESYFDVYYDVTITDIDSTAGFFGGAGVPVLQITDLGPANMSFFGECIADTSKVNLGCLPPSGNPYVGHFQIDQALGVDVNGNGEEDHIKFEFGAHNVGGVTNTFLDGNQLVDEFSSTIVGTGAVADLSVDPPFSFTLSGPTTASQGIVYAPQGVPLPGSLLLIGAGLGLLGLGRRRMG